MSDAVIGQGTAVDNAKAHVSHLELELDYAKTQLAETKQEKKDAEKLCRMWKEMMMMKKARKMNNPAAPAFGGAYGPQSRAGKMMVTTKFFETQLEQIKLNPRENNAAWFSEILEQEASLTMMVIMDPPSSEAD
jgi:hypothetical protein